MGLLSLGLCLGACAASGTQYPSFTIPTASADSQEQSSRVSMRFPAVAVPAFPDNAAASPLLPAEMDARLAAITTRADAAARAFMSDSEAIRALARAAGARNPESDRWAEAQIGLAALTSHHTNTHLAVADLDALATTAQIAGAPDEDSAAIAALQSQYSQTLDEQSRQLAAITALLDP